MWYGNILWLVGIRDASPEKFGVVKRCELLGHPKGQSATKTLFRVRLNDYRKAQCIEKDDTYELVEYTLVEAQRYRNFYI